MNEHNSYGAQLPRGVWTASATAPAPPPPSTLLPRPLTLVGVGSVIHATVAIALGAVYFGVSTAASTNTECERLREQAEYARTAVERMDLFAGCDGTTTEANDSLMFVGVLLALAGIALLAAGLLRLTRPRLPVWALYVPLAVLGVVCLSLFSISTGVGMLGLVGTAISGGLIWTIWSGSRPVQPPPPGYPTPTAPPQAGSPQAGPSQAAAQPRTWQQP